MKNQYKKGFISLVTIFLIILGVGVVGGGYVIYQDKQDKKEVIQDLTNLSSIDIKSPLFTKQLSELGFSAYAAYSLSPLLLPSNKYILLGVGSDYYFSNLKNGDMEKIEGYPKIGNKTTDKFLTSTDTGINIYDVDADGVLSVKKIINPAISKVNAYIPNEALSPDDNWMFFIDYKKDSFGLIEIKSGEITWPSNLGLQNEKPVVWFSDSKRILGFSGIYNVGECEGCPDRGPAEDSRKLTIWNIESKTYDDNIGISTPPLSYRLEWMMLDKSALLYTSDARGSEGDSILYVFNLEDNSISLLGEDIGSLSQIKVDQVLERIAQVSINYVDIDNELLNNISTISFYDIEGKNLYKHIFTDNFRRTTFSSYLNIVSSHQILYARRSKDLKSGSDVILFDLNSKKEKVLYHTSEYAWKLLLSGDKKTWILLTKKQLIAQDL